MLVNVRQSKTVQFRERILSIPVTAVDDPALCAVYWVRRQFLLAGQGDHVVRIWSRGVSGSMLYPVYLTAIKYMYTYL